MPNSSLAHYLGLALRDFGTKGSDYLINDWLRHGASVLRADARGADRTALCPFGGQLQLCAPDRRFQRQGRSFALPEGSRCLDTGGFKGQSRELAANEFYDELSATLGVETPMHQHVRHDGA